MSAVLERSVAYERTYLATVVAYPELYDRHRVESGDVATPQYRDLLESVLTLHMSGARVTPSAIRAELDRRGLTRLAHSDLLDTLGDIEPDLEPVAIRIRELAVTRRMRVEAAALTKALAREDLKGARDVVGRLALAHDPSTERDPVMTFGELLEKSVIAIRDEGSKQARLIRIGSPTLDRYCRLSPGTMLTIGARPNVGKSTLVMTWALSLARGGIPCGVVSVEDPPEDWGAKAMGEIAGIDPGIMWRGELSARHWETMLEKIPGSRDLPISFTYVSDRAIDGVLARMEYMRRVRGARVIFVDYLNAIDHRKAPSPRERIDSTIAAVLSLAGRLDVALVMAAQIARPEKGHPFREPQLTDLKESGTIEERSASVVLLWRKSDKPDEPVHAKIAKVKRQPVGKRFTLARDPRTHLLVEQAEEGERWPSDEDAPEEAYR